MEKKELIILIDMDNTLAMTNLGFDLRWKKTFKSQIPILWNNRKKIYIKDNFPMEMKIKIDYVFSTPGFYQDLQPIVPAINAVKFLIENQYKIFFCTRPNELANNCILDKQIWIKKYFGEKFSEKIIYTYDKKMCQADILIDDVIEKFNITTKPTWKQLLVDTNHNQNIKTKLPRIKQDWSNWKKIYNDEILNFKK